MYVQLIASADLGVERGKRGSSPRMPARLGGEGEVAISYPLHALEERGGRCEEGWWPAPPPPLVKRACRGRTR